jgi:hypothetical protein
MFVSAETFEKMWLNSQGAERRNVHANSGLGSSFGLKNPCLKTAIPERTSKDAEDVVQLAKRNHLDFSDPKYEELFLKYGTRELYEAFLRILRH